MFASDDGEDRIRAFVESCWHVKDHALADLAGAARASFEKDVEASTPLRVIADLANRSKHVVLTRRDRVGASMNIKKIDAYDGSVSGPAKANFEVTLADGTVHSVTDIANAALVAWEPILTKYGL